MTLLRAAALVAVLGRIAADVLQAAAFGRIAEDVVPAGDRQSACAAEGDGDACGDQTGLLQMGEVAHCGKRVNATAGGENYTWRVAPEDSGVRDCGAVCRAYGATCVEAAFRQALDARSAQEAKRQATGTGCPHGEAVPSAHPAAPYFGTTRIRTDCRYARSVGRCSSGCAALPPSGTQRICPCSATRVQLRPAEECKQLRGIFCPGRDIECNCNYCDDFKEDNGCANSCRVLNGYVSSPFPGAPWSAKNNSAPTDVQFACDCTWMRGRGDDCKKCDGCAYDCRKQNPFPKGTCRR